jgi:hypothetical protein
MPKVTKKTLNCRGRLVSLETPVVMGILNITPDSFFAGSRMVLPFSILVVTRRDPALPTFVPLRKQIGYCPLLKRL